MEKSPKMESSKNFSRREVLLGSTGAAADLVLPSSSAESSERVETDHASESNAEYVRAQIADIKRIIDGRVYGDILRNHYLASCVYYSESFFQ